MKYEIRTPHGLLDVTDYRPELNFQFEDLGEYTSALASYSGDCPLPGTSTNKRFFKEYHDCTSITEFNANRKTAVEIYADSALVFAGYMKLTSIAMEDSIPTYNVTFFENTRDFSDVIQDLELIDLDWSNLNHTRNTDTIAASWTGQLGEGYVYPKEISGNFDNAAATFSWQWNPATYVKTMWDKTFAKAGFTYSSEFLNSEYFRRLIVPYGKSVIEMTADQILEKTVKAGVSASLPPAQSGSTLPENFHATNDGQVSGEGWLNLYGIQLDDTTSSTFEFTNVAGQWNGEQFNNIEPGFYDIAFHAPFAFKYDNPLYSTFQLTDGSLEFHWEMYLNKSAGGSVMIADSGRDINPPYGLQYFTPLGYRNRGTIYTNENFVINMVSTAVWMDPGDIVTIQLHFKHPESCVWKDNPGSIGGIIVDVRPMILRNIGSDVTYFSVKPSSNVLTSERELQYSQLIPAIKCVDFVSDIKTMFNLVFRPDPKDDKNIIIEPYDTYFESRKVVSNWDKLLDHSDYELIPTANDIAQTYRYTYTADEDYFNKKYLADTGKIYGEQSFTTTNDINTDTEEIEIGFSPTPVASAFNATQFVQPWYTSINTTTPDGETIQVEAVSVNPRILFYGGLVDTTSYSIQSSANASGTSFTQYPYCGHWDNPTDPRWDLNWGMTVATYWTTTVSPGKNLFNQFHRNALLNRVDPGSRILKGQFDLNSDQIAQLDPRDRIFCLGSYWRVLDLKWIDSETLAEATLLKQLDISEQVRTTFAVPDTISACPSDLVAKKSPNNNFYYYASTSGQRVTEACCVGLAGTWTDGLCVVPNVAPPKPSNPGPILVTAAQVSTDRNQTIMQRGATGKSSGVTTRGAGNLASNSTRNANVIGSNNLLNNANNIIVLGSDNAIYNTRQSIIAGNANNIPEYDYTTPGDTTRTFILGDANTIEPGTSLVTMLGSNMTATTSSTTYIQNVKLSGKVEIPYGATLPADASDGQLFIQDIGSGEVLLSFYLDGAWKQSLMN